MMQSSKQQAKAELRKKRRDAAEGPSPKAEDGAMFNPYQSKKAFQKASASYTKPQQIDYEEVD